MGIVLHNPQAAMSLPDQRTVASQRNWRPLYWLGAGLLLLVLQLMSGTGPAYAGLVFLFALFTYLTVKTLGGLDTLTGILVVYMAAQHVLISQVAKIYFWQPADERLVRPLDTIGVYTVAMCALWVAALVSNATGVGRRRALFTADLSTRQIYWLALATTTLALARSVVTFGASGSGAATGGILGPINTLVFLPNLAIACCTAYVIRSSQGRRSFGLWNGSIIFALSLLGVLGTTRLVILGPFVTYLLTCVAFRFRFRVSHFVLFGVLLLIAFRLLFPLALMGRNIAHNSRVSLMTNWGASFSLLIKAIEDPSFLPDAQKKQDKQRRIFRYYDNDTNLQELSRYTLIVTTDAIINSVQTQGTFGMKTIEPGFVMLVPRFIAPEKPFAHSDNLLAHRVPGLVNKGDVTTGISLGYIADAFSSFAWAGAAVIPFLIGFCYFTFYRFIITDKMWTNVWVLAFVLPSSWSFSENPIEGQIAATLEGPFVMTISFWLLLKFARACERLQPFGRLLQHFDSRARRRTRYSA